MTFFKKYNGTANSRLQRLERLVWLLIYGGLLTLVLAWFVENTQASNASGLYALGVLAVAMGLVAFYLRARHPEE